MGGSLCVCDLLRGESLGEGLVTGEKVKANAGRLRQSEQLLRNSVGKGSGIRELGLESRWRVRLAGTYSSWVDGPLLLSCYGMGVLPDAEEPSVRGWVGNHERSRDHEGTHRGPFMGPGGSEGSALVVGKRPCRWELLPESLFAAPGGRHIRFSPFAGPWSGPVCDTAPGDVSHPRLNSLYLLEQESQIAAVGGPQRSGSRCVAPCSQSLPSAEGPS